MKLEETLNLPDLQFNQYCEQRFDVNKGIYNTIDNWFYNQGIKCIVERRKTVLQFLYEITLNKGKVKFGPGGLTRKLQAFWEKRQIQSYAN